MDRIPTALERALERVEKLGKASPEELKQSKYAEEGQKLAARYLKGKLNLRTELNNYDDEIKAWLIQGIQEILIRNIELPSDDASKQQNRLAMEGLKVIKKDPGAVENVFSKIRQIFNHYTGQGELQRKEAFENLKRETQVKLSQAMQQQGMPPVPIQHVEAHPQFQMEWHKVQAQLDSQYDLHMKEYKEQLTAIP